MLTVVGFVVTNPVTVYGGKGGVVPWFQDLVWNLTVGINRGLRCAAYSFVLNKKLQSIAFNDPVQNTLQILLKMRLRVDKKQSKNF